MIVRVEKGFHKLETQRKALFESVGGLTPEQQIFRIDENSWHILQVFDHLNLAERNGLAYLKKKIRGVDKLDKAGMAAGFRTWILLTALRLPIKYKAPTATQAAEREQYDFRQIKEEWSATREDYREFLEMIDAPTSKKLLFRHPTAGRITILQTLAFMYEHVHHHERQIKRIMNHKKFPGKK